MVDEPLEDKGRRFDWRILIPYLGLFMAYRYLDDKNPLHHYAPFPFRERNFINYTSLSLVGVYHGALIVAPFALVLGN